MSFALAAFRSRQYNAGAMERLPRECPSDSGRPWRVLFPVALALLACAGILLLPGLWLPAGPRRGVAIGCAAVILWMAPALPLPIGSLVILLLLGLLRGELPLAQVLQGFSSPVIFFLLGVLAIGSATVKTGLAWRLLGLLLGRGSRGPWAMFRRLLCSLPLQPILIPSAITRNAILVPAFQQFFGRIRLPPRSGIARATFLGLGTLNAMASSAFLTGGLVPITSSTLLGGFTWTRWFLLLSVPYFSLILVGGVVLWALYGRGPEKEPPGWGMGEIAGRLSRDERRVLGVLVPTILLWLTDALHGLSPALPALFAGTLLYLPGTGVLSWRDLDRDGPLSLLVTVGTALSLAQFLTTSGAPRWAADQLLASGVREFLPLVVWVTLLVLLITIVHLGVPNLSGAIALLIPVVGPLAAAVGISPLASGLMVTIVVDTVILYPAQTTTILLSHSTGQLETGDVVRFGLIMCGVTVAMMNLVILPYWRLLGAL